MAYLDPNIPLRMPQQPTFAEQAGQAFQLADVVEKQKAMQQQRQDSANLQQYLKEGGNLDTPDGIAKAMEWGKGNLSLGAYQTLVSAGQELRKNEQQRILALAQTDAAKIDTANKKNSMFMQSANPVLMQYEEDKQKFGEQQASENFKSNWQKQVQNVSQLGVFTPQELQDASTWTPQQTQSKLQSTEYGQKLLNEALTRKKTQQDIETGQAEESRKKEMFPLEKQKVKAQITESYESAAEKRAKREAGIGDATSFEQLPADKQDLAKANATGFLITGKNAPARAGGYTLQQIGLVQLAKEFDTSVSELQLAAMDVKTQLQAKPQVEKRIQALDRASNQLAAEIPVMEAAMKRLDLPGLPILARGNIWALREMGNPDVTKLDQSANVVFNEFETVKTGNPGALYVANMEDSKKQYQQVKTPQQMRAWIENARDIIDRAKKSNMQTRREIMEGVKNSLRFNKASGEAPAAGAPAAKPALPNFKTGADIRAAMQSGAIKSGEEFIGPDGKKHTLK